MRVKLLALTVLIVGNLVAHQAYAEDVSTQPLTRAGCESGGIAWDETANVCIGNAGVSGQPLSRLDCDNAGMTWNDNANVCADQAGLAVEAASTAKTPDASDVLVNIDKSTQRMTVFVDGVEQYDWPVSTGQAGYSTPSGNYTASSMNEIWYSKQWDNAPMPHAVFFTKEGHAIHGTNEVKRLGKPASHGCVRLSPQNAATLYALVADNGLQNTQVILVGLTPGGESKVASGARSKFRDRDVSELRPQRRGGFFKRLFGSR
jgi:lipoprotein-anchoring transpeptidase ErfK/SrfK